MTREEAIAQLKMDRDLANFNPMTGEEEPMNEDCRKSVEALDMAIKALEQQPCEDTISRQVAIECNGDYIRQMDNDRLARFLFIWQVNFISMFFESGFTDTMNAQQLKEWIRSNEWACKEVEVGEDFVFDSEFNLKGEQDE